jgi:hypothetical protein
VRAWTKKLMMGESRATLWPAEAPLCLVNVAWLGTLWIPFRGFGRMTQAEKPRVWLWRRM